MKRFIEGQDRSQVMLLPEFLDGYFGQGNPVRVVDAFLDAGALPTLHERYGISREALAKRIKGWLG
jgi:hypothetical protein